MDVIVANPHLEILIIANIYKALHRLQPLLLHFTSIHSLNSYEILVITTPISHVKEWRHRKAKLLVQGHITRKSRARI